MYNRYCFFLNVNIDKIEVLIYRARSDSVDINDKKNSLYNRDNYKDNGSVYNLFN